MAKRVTNKRAAKIHAQVLAALFHHRWTLPVLAEVQRGRGSKFVTLVKRLGVGRDTLSRTLKVLVERGWIQRNPGYGHPLRPEYIFTEAGKELGPPALRLYEELTHMDVVKLGLKKWSMPTLAAVALGPRRFNELSSTLADATPRALTSALKQMVAENLVARELLDGFPPRVYYSVTDRGQLLIPALRELAQITARLES